MIGDRFAQVLGDAKNGSELAFSEMYRDLAPVVISYIRGNGVRDAEDVANETFIAVARHIKKFDGAESGFRSWVLTIAHRKMIDDRRRVFRKREQSAPAEVLAQQAFPDSSAESFSAQAGSFQRALEMLEKLTPDQRQVVTLRIITGLSVAEAAQIMGKSESAVKVLQHRAVNALARSLGEQGE